MSIWIISIYVTCTSYIYVTCTCTYTHITSIWMFNVCMYMYKYTHVTSIWIISMCVCTCTSYILIAYIQRSQTWMLISRSSRVISSCTHVYYIYIYMHTCKIHMHIRLENMHKYHTYTCVISVIYIDVIYICNIHMHMNMHKYHTYRDHTREC